MPRDHRVRVSPRSSLPATYPPSESVERAADRAIGLHETADDQVTLTPQPTGKLGTDTDEGRRARGALGPRDGGRRVRRYAWRCI